MKAVRDKKVRILLASLLVGSGLLFALAVNIERGGEAAEENSTHRETSTGEAAEEESRESESQEHSEEGESGETLLGVNLESPVLVALGVAASILLAALLMLWNGRTVLGLAAAFAGVFGLMDLRELFHQVNESRANLIVLAAVLALAHFAVTLIAARTALATADT